MPAFNIGDIVVRKSYGGDVYFKITDIVKVNCEEDRVILKGLDHRLIADAPPSDLKLPDLEDVNSDKLIYSKRVNKNVKRILSDRRSMGIKDKRGFRDDETFGRSGRILHIDADEEYLNTCIKTYKQLNLEVTPKLIAEASQPEIILDLLNEVKPDILVLTGHDGMLKGQNNYTSLDSYRSSRFFVEAVKVARSYDPSLDDLVIFAGACQSFYEAIIEAGANYASSPHRVLIHALDPVFICEKVAYTGINKVLTIQEAISNTITGIKGIGGLETRGKYRQGFPKSLYS
ncbi:sporulation-specific protease YabG [Oxobacter pfennigii]|uniref:Sporulation-specific protease YabG n=1 Tax=Oxobacter pfennigii TaxID=36849 RepID=A0A0P8X185_9CLOT|nr:sporulation peptidase YabG [Oxobacter pfennigii]KPU44566.1 sporulation-specific protease YabG [Oxobacter pfennigii]